jgi:hypothetical protein
MFLLERERRVDPRRIDPNEAEVPGAAKPERLFAED